MFISLDLISHADYYKDQMLFSLFLKVQCPCKWCIGEKINCTVDCEYGIILYHIVL